MIAESTRCDTVVVLQKFDVSAVQLFVFKTNRLTRKYLLSRICLAQTSANTTSILWADDTPRHRAQAAPNLK
ncbi:MAG: hypothetical protein ACK4RS_01455 [Thiothrix sp.]